MNKRNEIPQLASSELAVMDWIWQQPQPVTAREIREQLYGNETKAQHGTVQRLLQRLEIKGFVLRDKRLNVHLFAAAISREQYAGAQLEDLAGKLTSGSIAPFITHLVEHDRISVSEIDRIREILDEYKSQSTDDSTIRKSKKRGEA